MHLLSAQAGAIQQEGEAIDLGQSPGAFIFASSADSELSMLAAAADRSGETELRLANTLRLANNLSVDLWLENTVRHARLVVLRLIGGIAYFQYGVDELTALCANKRIPLILLPGDANPDPILRDRSTVHPDDWHKLHGLFVAGGPGNADAILDAFTALAAPASAAEPRVADLAPQPFPRFGLWHPYIGITDEAGLRTLHGADRPHIPILFYRAALEGAGTDVVEALISELEQQGLAPVPLLVSSLKEGACVRFVQNALAAFRPSAILNLTAFAIGLDGLDDKHNPFSSTDAPVIQLIQSGRSAAEWSSDPQGLSAKDLAMTVVMPELDGRIGGIIVGHKADAVWHERTQCPLTAYAPEPSGIRRTVTLARNWTRLRHTPRPERRIAVILSNYPLRDGRLANGVGYDAPESTVRMLRELKREGYAAADIPTTAADLMARLQSGPTNANPQRGQSDAVLPLARYRELLAPLPEQLRQSFVETWGDAATDPFVREGSFHLPVHRFGNVVVLLQPGRTHGEDDATSYHDPNRPPPHAYVAAYLWLRHEFGAHALIHNGKHGTLEWLPGKAVALDDLSWPDALWAQLPHLYPFIVNDPGEGTQAKRRTGAVIIDHLVPPLTRAETYGPLKDLEALLDEYYAASGMDRRRLDGLRRRILDFTRDARLDQDIGLPEDETEALIRIDNFLCDLKEAQIRDGLHVFGQSPAGALERDLTVALTRVPRGESPEEASLIRALADDLKLGFDPLTAELGQPWRGPFISGADSIHQQADAVHHRPAEGVHQPSDSVHLPSESSVRRVGDVVSALEDLAARLVSGETDPAPDWSATRAVMKTVQEVVQPRLRLSGPAETSALLNGLDGKLVGPGPSGAPSRGRLDVLPTGRNFYSVDPRAVPTPTAWELGRKSAENLVLRHLQDHGQHLRAVAISVWGTANMRTGGDDIAQALALIGARPTWDPGSLRLSGYEIIPLARLGRPRVDVTLRISGFFRDAFPTQIALFDRAARAIGALDEPEEENPIAARMRSEALGLMAAGKSKDEAALEAGHRIFGSRPGSYGAGLNALIDSGNWSSKADLAGRALDWGQYAYGAKADGLPQRDRFALRLSGIDAVVHNQDNREHDLLDSDNYYQFQGGLAAAAETLTGRAPAAYHNDHSRPERPRIRTLSEEIAHVMRSRVVNPKWIAGMMRHGYRGAFEIIATVDFMFAFAATTGAVKSHHFDLAFDAFVEDDRVREFISNSNRFGYDELIAKFNEARERGLWSPRSNAAYAYLEETAL
ncbi:cobaltochelatase subunit CobN [Devosia albogilva]|uniref:Cobaltochelatase subunit CobN n=1 Tax=Devosia albogilva TaxID=429726 RepID=A0ABW5QLS3_9HYPH